MCVLSAPTVAKPKKKRRKKRGDLNQIVSSIGKGYKPRKMTLAQMLQMIHEVRSWPQLGTVRDSLYLRAGCMLRKMAARSTRTSKSMTRWTTEMATHAVRCPSSCSTGSSGSTGYDSLRSARLWMWSAP